MIAGEVARKAFESVVKYVCDPDGKIGDLLIPEHPGTHMMLKKLILHDNNKHVQGQGDGEYDEIDNKHILKNIMFLHRYRK